MAEGTKLEIVSPERLLLSEAVRSVTVPGADGYFTVLGDHAPLMTTLKPGFVTAVDTAGASHVIFVRGGFADVSPEGLTILADEAKPAAEFNRAESSSSSPKSRPPSTPPAPTTGRAHQRARPVEKPPPRRRRLHQRHRALTSAASLFIEGARGRALVLLDTHAATSQRLLPLWEKVAEGRMRVLGQHRSTSPHMSFRRRPGSSLTPHPVTEAAIIGDGTRPRQVNSWRESTMPVSSRPQQRLDHRLAVRRVPLRRAGQAGQLAAVLVEQHGPRQAGDHPICCSVLNSEKFS